MTYYNDNFINGGLLYEFINSLGLEKGGLIYNLLDLLNIIVSLIVGLIGFSFLIFLCYVLYRAFYVLDCKYDKKRANKKRVRK